MTASTYNWTPRALHKFKSPGTADLDMPRRVHHAGSFTSYDSKDDDVEERADSFETVLATAKHHDRLSSALDLQDKEANALPSLPTHPQGSAHQGPPKPGGIDPRSFPDGGLSAWLCVIGGWCCLFCSFGWINAIGIFQAYYQTHQLSNFSPSTVSWIPALQVFMMFACGPLIGKWYDNQGPRYILLTGTFLHVFGLMMTSLASEYYQIILAQGVCSAVGASMIFHPSISTTATWFFKRRALAFGIVTSGSGVGGVIFPIMVDRVVRQVGFGWAMRSTAFLILCLMIIANLTIRSRIPPTPKPLQIKEFVRPFSEVPFLLTTLGSFFFFMGMFLPLNYLIIFARSQHLSRPMVETLIPLLNAASLFGRVIPGWAADKIGRYNVMFILMLLTAIVDLALWLPSHGSVLTIIFSILYGFSSGAVVSMGPALIAQISDVRQIGVRTGSFFAIISIAALISNPIGGALIELYDRGFRGIQIYTGIMQLAGAAFVVLARTSLVGTRVKAKV